MSPQTEAIIGARWEAKVQGRDSLNGKRYQLTIGGTVQGVFDDETNVYDAIHELVDAVEAYRVEDDAVAVATSATIDIHSARRSDAKAFMLGALAALNAAAAKEAT